MPYLELSEVGEIEAVADGTLNILPGLLVGGVGLRRNVSLDEDEVDGDGTERIAMFAA